MVRAARRNRPASAVGALCPAPGTVDECVRAGTAAANRFAHTTCLYRALTVHAMLVHRHRASRFHIGAARAGELAIHAWVTIDGCPLDGEAHRYLPLWTAPTDG